jgi:hypothetical protein
MPARMELAKLFYRRGILEESRIYLNDALKMMEPPSAEALWLGYASSGNSATGLRRAVSPRNYVAAIHRRWSIRSS